MLNKINFVFFLSCLLLLFVSSSLIVADDSLVVSNYKLDSGDSIRISIFGEEDMLLETKLDDSGLITYPYIEQPIKISGMSVKQLEEFLLQRLKPDVFINPSIQISVMEYRPFFVNGQVNSPGGYPFQPGLNVSKAITLAGGLTERASESNIYVVRATDASESKIKVQLNDKIFPGDVLSIDESFF